MQSVTHYATSIIAIDKNKVDEKVLDNIDG